MIKKKAPKKPRPSGENLDLPRVYAVRTPDGNVFEATGQSERAEVIRTYPESQVQLMGTNEDLRQLERRVGWDKLRQTAAADELVWTSQEQGEYGP